MIRTLPLDLQTGAVKELRDYSINRVKVTIMKDSLKSPKWISIDYIESKNDTVVETDTFICENVISYKVLWK